MFKNIKNIRTVLIVLGVIAVSILGIKIINLIRDTGLVENKDKKIGELKVIKDVYKKENEDLNKKIKIINKIKKKDTETTIKIIKKDKSITKKFNKIKKHIHKTIEKTKEIAKTTPKNISEPTIKVNPFVYREAGKTMINSIWEAYGDVKDNK